MKHIMLTLGVATLFATSLSAQDLVPETPAKMQNSINQQSQTPAEHAKKDADNAEKQLGLSSDQKVKWEAASLEKITANQPIREKMKASTTPQERKDYRSQMMQNQKKYDETVTALLTPEQKTKYDQIKSERKEAHKGKMNGKHHMKNGRN